MYLVFRAALEPMGETMAFARSSLTSQFWLYTSLARQSSSVTTCRVESEWRRAGRHHSIPDIRCLRVMEAVSLNSFTRRLAISARSQPPSSWVNH